MEVTIRATPQQVRNLVRQLRNLTTNPSASNRLARAILIRAGLAALGNIQQAFSEKADGGQDIGGNKWQPLALSTIRKRQKKGKKGAKVQILRDTGALYNSLTPGISSAPGHLPSRKQHQIFQLEGRSVIIGTSRFAALYHHEGRPPYLPKRRLWPEYASWPAAWKEDMVAAARAGLIEVIKEILSGGTV